MTTPLTYNLTLPSDIFVFVGSLCVCLSVCLCDEPAWMTTVSVSATACFLSQPLSCCRRRARLCRSALPMAGPRPCGLSATRCRVPRAPRGYAAVRDWRLTPQLWARRAPRRHALALKAKLQRLARVERRAAASGPRASQATRRQPVSRFRSTQVRTVRQMSQSQDLARPKTRHKGTRKKSPASPIPVDPTAPQPQPSKKRRRRGRRAHLELLQRLMSNVVPARHRRALAARHDV